MYSFFVIISQCNYFCNRKRKSYVSESNGFELRKTRHFRIKILDERAFHLANFSIPIWWKVLDERLVDYSGSTFNYNATEGRLDQAKVGKQNIFDEKMKGFTNKKFTFPLVKKGSIIEFSYTVASKSFLYVFGQTFQRDYPIELSTLEFIVPTFFQYKSSLNGSLKPDILQTDHEDNVSSIDKGMIKELFKDTPTFKSYSRDWESDEKNYLYVYRNVPGFKHEPAMAHYSNFLPNADFELHSVTFPNGRYLQNWNWMELNKFLYQDDDFGVRIKATDFPKSIASEITMGQLSNLEKAKSIYYHIQNRMLWEDRYGLFVFDPLKKVYESKTGNSSEINMLLVKILKDAGLNADAALISTVDNGEYQAAYPSLSKFNNVIVRLEIDSVNYWLDATCKECPFGVLPLNSNVDEARVINSTGGGWLPIQLKCKNTESKSYTLNIQSDGTAKGTMRGKYDGYMALKYRVGTDKKSEDGSYSTKNFDSNISPPKLEDVQVKNRFELEKPVNDSMGIEIKNFAESVNEKLVISPFLLTGFSSNIFIEENRSFPIHFPYSYSSNQIFEIQIPEGFKVESLPLNRIIQLAHGGAHASFSAKVIGSKVNLSLKFVIDKNNFPTSDYSDLREFFNQLAQKCQETIVLSK